MAARRLDQQAARLTAPPMSAGLSAAFGRGAEGTHQATTGGGEASNGAHAALPSASDGTVASPSVSSSSSTSTAASTAVSVQRTVAAHYNLIQQKDRDAREESAIIGVKRFNNWVKAVLITRFTPPRAVVLDLCCGKVRAGAIPSAQKGACVDARCECGVQASHSPSR